MTVCLCREYNDESAHTHTHTGPVGGIDCVHILNPSLHGTGAVIAAGSRDSLVYIWRKRSDDAKEGSRAMRSFTTQTLSAHRVHAHTHTHTLSAHRVHPLPPPPPHTHTDPISKPGTYIICLFTVSVL